MVFETPILLIVFNRPSITQLSFDQIKKVKPRFLFVAADGPRADKPDDIQRCFATRKIFEQVDWPCELRTLYRHQNLGCGYGPAEAISWFFKHVEQGIILEDDCLAHESFFSFCEEILNKYKDNEKVSMIGGTNALLGWNAAKQSYLFTNMGFSWGWASWRRAWKHFDYSASLWKTPEGKERVKRHLKNVSYFAHFANEFDSYFQDVRPDVWDFQWLFSCFYQESYCIMPTTNLISNIGFDDNATHTFNPNTNVAHLKQIGLKFPLKHPPMKINSFFEWYYFNRFISSEKRSIIKKIILKSIKLASVEK